jgi:hypothetical protein
LDDFYINHKHKHNYKCICGRLDSIQFKHFKRGVRCKECGHVKKGKKRRNSLEKVIEKTASYGCVFLSEEYKTCKDVYKFQCNCGNNFECPYDDFLSSGQRCNFCSKTGFDKSVPAFLYLVSRTNQFKIGIYNEGNKRLNTHKKNGWSLVQEIRYRIGLEAYEQEKEILNLLDKKGIPRGSAAFREPFDGYTESWNAFDLFVDSFESLFSKLCPKVQSSNYPAIKKMPCLLFAK